MQTIYIKCIDSGATKKVSPHIFSARVGSRVESSRLGPDSLCAAQLCSARLLKFDGRMTFLSYFCQPETARDNNDPEAASI